MFFAENEILLDMVGVFKIKRENYSLKTPKSRNYDSLSIRLHGTGKFTIDGNTFSVTNGDVLYLPKNGIYEQQTSSETIITIHFINYSFHSESNFELLKIDDYAYIEDLFQRLYNIWKEKKSGYRYQSTALFYELLYFLHRNEEVQSFRTEHCIKKINEAIDYIHIHFRNETININDLCKRIAVSDTYFRKLFKKIYNVSPKQYIINLKLELASQLLQSHFYSVTEVSDKAGFGDTKYFSKLFKKQFGVSPKKFQQDYEYYRKIN